MVQLTFTASIALVQLALLAQTSVGLPIEYVLFRYLVIFTDSRSGLGQWLNRERWQHQTIKAMLSEIFAFIN